MRNTKELVIKLSNRDDGKVFVITEMDPYKAEKWASRALLALGRSGAPLSDEIMQAGFAGVVNLGVRAFFGLRWEDAEPLLDEMMTCVQIRPPGGVLRAPSFDGDIEEVATLLFLRQEIITLHTGFSLADARSALDAQRVKTDGNSPNTKTSPGQSAS